jgi:hypothetical protein
VVHQEKDISWSSTGNSSAQAVFHNELKKLLVFCTISVARPEIVPLPLPSRSRARPFGGGDILDEPSEALEALEVLEAWEIGEVGDPRMRTLTSAGLDPGIDGGPADIVVFECEIGVALALML